jgi:hypothetical protein
MGTSDLYVEGSGQHALLLPVCARCSVVPVIRLDIRFDAADNSTQRGFHRRNKQDVYLKVVFYYTIFIISITFYGEIMICYH